MKDAQGNFTSGDCVELVASSNEPKFFPYSLSVSPPDILESQTGGVVQNLLETGAINDDAMYSNDVNEVARTIDICNKRISCVG